MSEQLSIYARLSAAQSKMTNPAKRGTNPHFKSSYALLEDVIATIKAPLVEHGLFLQQPIEILETGEQVVKTIVSFEGESLVLGAVKIPEGTMQAVGSAITYARRYMLLCAFGLCGEDDDDGNAATAHQTKARKTQESLADKKEHLKQRIKLANTLGLADSDIKLWVEQNIGKTQAQMNIEDISFVTDYIEREIKQLSEAHNAQMVVQ